MSNSRGNPSPAEQRGATQASRSCDRSVEDFKEKFTRELEGYVKSSSPEEAFNKIAQLLRRLNTQFRKRFPKSKDTDTQKQRDHTQTQLVDALCKILETVSRRDQLAMVLRRDAPLHGAHITAAIRDRLEDTLRAEIKAPEKDEADPLFAVTEWIKKGYHTADTQGSDAERDAWIRKAFLCLAAESDDLLRAVAIRRLLEAIASGHKGRKADQHKNARDGSKSFRPDCGEYLRRVADLLSKNKITGAAVANALQFMYPSDRQREEDRGELDRVRGELAAESSRRQDLERRADEFARELRETQMRLRETEMHLRETQMHLRELEASLQGATDRVETEREANRQLRVQFQLKLQQDLARQRHSIRSTLEHHIGEAQRALDREAPNVAMARDRLAAVQQALRTWEEPS